MRKFINIVNEDFWQGAFEQTHGRDQIELKLATLLHDLHNDLGMTEEAIAQMMGDFLKRY